MAANSQQLKELIKGGSASLGIILDDAVVHGLLVFMLELEKWNRKINLIARHTTLAEIIDKHILDSLMLLPFLNDQGNKEKKTIKNEIIKLVDIGTGAGFPGLPIAIARPDFQVVLMEPRAKRVSFLGHIVRSLGLANVVIMAERFIGSEQFVNRQIEFVTGRAVVEPGKFLAMVQPLLSGRTNALLMLGPNKRDLWCGDNSAGDVEIIQYLDFVLPVSGGKRTIYQVGEKCNSSNFYKTS